VSGKVLRHGAAYPSHDWTAVITTYGRICDQRRKIKRQVSVLCRPTTRQNAVGGLSGPHIHELPWPAKIPPLRPEFILVDDHSVGARYDQLEKWTPAGQNDDAKAMMREGRGRAARTR
jgi:hypothetical protein